MIKLLWSLAGPPNAFVGAEEALRECSLLIPAWPCQTGSHCVSLAGLELAMQSRLALHS